MSLIISNIGVPSDPARHVGWVLSSGLTVLLFRIHMMHQSLANASVETDSERGCVSNLLTIWSTLGVPDCTYYSCIYDGSRYGLRNRTR
jgi:hypothetical protein